jgi:hypothetical protein
LFEVVDATRGAVRRIRGRRSDESLEHSRKIVYVPEREMLGTGSGGVQDLTAARALVEAGDHDRQLRTPGFDSTHERADCGTTPATESDDDQRGTLIA